MSEKWPFSNEQPFQHQYHIDDQSMQEQLAAQLFQRFRTVHTENDLVLVCIGTDRSTGDAFGPLTGTMVDENSPKHFFVYGTLSHPVHALNLENTMAQIAIEHRRPLILAIDASMGKAQNIGRITYASGPVHPGSAVKKSLPATGDMHLTGTVNAGGMMEYFVLQNTRLHLVMNMAEITANALLLSDRLLSSFRKPTPLTVSRRYHKRYSTSGKEMSAPSKDG